MFQIFTDSQFDITHVTLHVNTLLKAVIDPPVIGIDPICYWIIIYIHYLEASKRQDVKGQGHRRTYEKDTMICPFKQ